MVKREEKGRKTNEKEKKTGKKEIPIYISSYAGVHGPVGERK